MASDFPLPLNYSGGVDMSVHGCYRVRISKQNWQGHASKDAPYQSLTILAETRDGRRISLTIYPEHATAGQQAMSELQIDGALVGDVREYRAMRELDAELGERIAELKRDAGEAGDVAQVELCTRALQGEAVAIERCERALADAAAQVGDVTPPEAGGTHDGSWRDA